MLVQVCVGSSIRDKLAVFQPLPLSYGTNIKICKDERELFYDPTLYRSLVGKLLCLTNTTCNLTYSVNLQSQFIAASQVPHYNTIVKILRRVKGTPRQGIFFSTTYQLELTAYANANCPNCLDTH